MLQYNKSYAWLIAPLFAINILAGAILFAFGYGRMTFLVTVALLIILNVAQRKSHVAFDKWWKTSIHKDYNQQEFSDAISKQTQMQIVLAIIAILISIK